jgi:hypothetical protein
MRLLLYPAAAAALSAVFMSLPVQAGEHQRHRVYASSRLGIDSGGFGTGPYWQGEPSDRRPIWRYGYYQGNDPDPFIRSQIMRDPTNAIGARSRR